MWYFAHNLLGSVSAAGKENPILAAEVFMFKRNVLVYLIICGNFFAFYRNAKILKL